MKMNFPEQCLVLLVGASGSGKSTFAARHFLATEVVSSDVCRGLVSDDPLDQAVSTDAFELLHKMLELRLRRGRFTVVDATNLRREDRDQLRRIAKDHDTLAAAVLFDTPERLCHERNQARPDRNFGPGVLKRHLALFRGALPSVKKERFHRIYRVAPGEEVAVERTRLWNDRRELTGPSGRPAQIRTRARAGRPGSSIRLRLFIAQSARYGSAWNRTDIPCWLSRA